MSLYAILNHGGLMDSHDTVTDPIRRLFGARLCWTIAELAEQLRRPAVSVRRLLARVGYYSSFTHNSKWYTLQDIPRFDRDGLWFYKHIGFSRRGTLARTLVHLASRSPAGMSAEQLGARLHCRCHGVLAVLCRNAELRREKLGRAYIYLAADPALNSAQRQELQRRTSSPAPLAAEAAVLVLAAFIRRPDSSCADLVLEVRTQSSITVSIAQIERLFGEHGVKKGGHVPRQGPCRH